MEVAYCPELQYEIPLIEALVGGSALLLILGLRRALLRLEAHGLVARLQLKAIPECSACRDGIVRSHVCCPQPVQEHLSFGYLLEHSFYTKKASWWQLLKVVNQHPKQEELMTRGQV